MISIITVVFNGEKTIEQTILSVCSQSHLPFEYIIVDGGSTDKTMQIVNFYAANYSFIKTISETDNGIYDAMNKGIRMAKGDIVGILNSDDWYEQTALKEVYSAFKEQGSGVYYGIQRNILDGKEYSLERSSPSFISKVMIPHPATFVTVDIYKKFGLFSENYRYSSDLDLVIRFSRNGVRFFPIDKILTNFRIGGASATVEAAVESMKIRKTYGLLSHKSYVLKVLKLRLKRFF